MGSSQSDDGVISSPKNAAKREIVQSDNGFRFRFSLNFFLLLLHEDEELMQQSLMDSFRVVGPPIL